LSVAISSKGKSRLVGVSVGIAMGVVLALVLSGVFLAAGPHVAGPQLADRPAGTTQQWAFGGYASAQYSCSSVSTCIGSSGGTGVSSINLNYNYNISWAVIYTQTNVSASQTMDEVQAGLGANVAFSLSECYTANSSPCQTTSLSLNLFGKEYGVGFTNLTTGTVDLTAGTGSPGSVAAQAVTNAASDELYNFSGSLNANVPAEDSSPAVSDSANFDFGGNESSQVNFATPLGLVPLDPTPGDQWTSNASYSATGSYTSGYSASYSIQGQSNTTSAWASTSVMPSGQLWVNGTDLGAVTLYDNYTNPPTQQTAQIILLNFTSGDEFSTADGWVFIPTGLFGGLISLLAQKESGVMPAASVPSQGSLAAGSTYYEPGTGFVGAAASSSGISSPFDVPGAQAPTVSLSAEPEPVSVAQSQYNGILTSSAPSSSSSTPYPWMWIAVAVVVVLVVVVAIVAVAMRSRRRKQPPAPMAPYPAGSPMPGAPGAPPGYPMPPPPGSR
jgi:hypothetical protein